MREIRQSGSEGGDGPKGRSLPYHSRTLPLSMPAFEAPCSDSYQSTFVLPTHIKTTV